MNKNKFRVDFIGVGAKKSGTTWLYNCLKEHPEICLSRKKEIFFFNEYDTNFPTVKNGKYRLGIKWYKRYFKNCPSGKLKGEISPTYLYSRKAAQRIKKHFPNVKILVILRDPVKRALSQYVDAKQTGIIGDISIGAAIKKDKTFIDRGLYYKHLTRYYKLFPKENILILLLEDIRKDPKRVIRKVYKFLKLKDNLFSPRCLNNIPNPASRPRLPFLNYFLMHVEYFLKKNNLHFIVNMLELLGIRRYAVKVKDLNSIPLAKYPRIDKKIQRYLKKVFRKDIQRLEKLLHRNLSAWK